MALSINEVSAVIAATKTQRDRALLALAYQFGLRRSEAGLLTRAGYDGGNLLVTRVKRRETFSHSLPLWGRTKHELDLYLAGRADKDPWLFASRKRGPIGPQAVYYVFRDAANKVGIARSGQHPHALRHAIIAHLLRAGMGMCEVNWYVGHKSSLRGALWYANKAFPDIGITAMERSNHVADWARSPIEFALRLTGKFEDRTYAGVVSKAFSSYEECWERYLTLRNKPGTQLIELVARRDGGEWWVFSN